MNVEGLKLTIYAGERERAGGGFLADALVETFARHELQTSVVLRGIAGFGARQHLRTDRLLSLSEDLPLVTVAVDTRERIERVAAEVRERSFAGLVTFERAQLLTGGLEAVELPPELHEATKLTVYLGRRQRVGGRPAYEAVVALLRRRGVAGATVLLGVDGTAHGVRQRARFFSGNADVPVMVIAVGDGAAITAALPELGTMLERPLATLERVRLCKRDGAELAGPPADPAPPGFQRKLTVFASEQSRRRGRPLYFELIRGLRAAGAAGATSVRGIWGYHGDHAPHGDSFWQLERRVPVVTALIDTPDRMREWYAVIDEVTAETGLVTSELVPA